MIAQQRRKEALRFHSQESADSAIKAQEESMVSASDGGHTFSLTAPAPQATPQTGEDLSRITENSDELLSTRDWGAKMDKAAEDAAKKVLSSFLCATTQSPNPSKESSRCKRFGFSAQHATCTLAHMTS